MCVYVHTHRQVSASKFCFSCAVPHIVMCSIFIITSIKYSTISLIYTFKFNY